MKISTNNYVKGYTGLWQHTADGCRTGSAGKSSHNFDEITIHSNPREIEEHSFMKAISSSISAEAAQPVSTEQVAHLRHQVASGTYCIDAQAIASRILLVGEEM